MFASREEKNRLKKSGDEPKGYQPKQDLTREMKLRAREHTLSLLEDGRRPHDERKYPEMFDDPEDKNYDDIRINPNVPKCSDHCLPVINLLTDEFREEVMDFYGVDRDMIQRVDDYRWGLIRLGKIAGATLFESISRDDYVVPRNYNINAGFVSFKEDMNDTHAFRSLPATVGAHGPTDRTEPGFVLNEYWVSANGFDIFKEMLDLTGLEDQYGRSEKGPMRIYDDIPEFD